MESSPAGESRRPPGISYLDGRRFRKLLLAGVRNVGKQRSELDRINVFPVPDGDTGTNLSLTLQSVAEAVRPLDSRSLGDVANAAAEASLLSARGNSGMLFAHLLLGFAEQVGRSARAGTREVSIAFSAAAERLHDVLEDPREGTIVSVVRDMAEAGVTNGTPPRGDLLTWLRDVQTAARESLRRTKDLLPALRQAGVVDAGAKGVVEFFEGIMALVEGRVDDASLEAPVGHEASGHRPSLYAAREAGVGAGEGRYCTQIVLRGDLPPTADIRASLDGLGTSTIIVRSGSVAKVHIHADAPDRVAEVLAAFGTVESRLTEDTMLVGTASHHTAVLTDSASDLPHEWVERHGVTVVPLQVIVGDQVYRDGVDLHPDELITLVKEPGTPLPKTSQPTPGAVRDACRMVLDHGAEELLGVFVSGAVSGTFASAASVLREFDEVPSAAVDSRSGSLGIGLLVIRAIELLGHGLSLPEVAEELRRVRDQSNVFFTVDTMEHLLRSGRIGRTKAWLGGVLDLKPILSLTHEGRIEPVGHARGRDVLIDRVFEMLDERLRDAREYRFGVAHVDAEETAAELAQRLEKRYEGKDVLVGPASAALGVHTGPGTWALAYQIEDGGPTS